MSHPRLRFVLLLAPFASLALVAAGTERQATDAAPFEIPLGLPRTIPGLDASPRGRALVRLGKRLFSDVNLSVDRSTACITCHPPEHGFASPERFPAGAYGRRTVRSAPTLINRALGKSFAWRGNVPSLEEQALRPFDDETEFALPVGQALARLAQDEEYVAMFAAAAGRAPDAETIGRALAAYLRTILVGDSPVDRFLEGDTSGLTTAERQGMWIFDSKGGCWKCHAGQGNFTDERFHTTGIGARDGVPAPGRFDFTGDEADRGRFKTPTLRLLTLTAPYMHDGSVGTLEEVVEFYRRGGNANSHLDPLLQPLSLTDEEAAHLLAFLRALSRS